MRRAFLILGLLTILGLRIPTNHAQFDNHIRANRLGIAHISQAGRDIPEERYQHALEMGAGWNRWPLYWNQVEYSPGHFNWDAYDQQIINDLRHGLEIDVILLGRPEFYADAFRIAGMYEPIFADGTDTPGSNKQLNPANPWVEFVYRAVQRYKPGGILSRQGDLPPSRGIRVWEVWNEPDVPTFWKASIHDYARLLKISYLVIKMADPAAQVMFAGILFANEDNWLAGVLNVYINDPMHLEYNWFMDIVAIHSYGDPWRTGWLTLFTKQTMLAFEFMRPIWVTESGIPVWDDYPGPTWDSSSWNRGTMEQQAYYFIQSTTYAWAEGADKVFLHQLYDDCGDQPGGTDFPPHNGELCVGDALCAGDAHGAYRNLRDSSCFSQHPSPGSARPLAGAYRFVAEIFGTEPFDSGEERHIDSSFVTLMFKRPRTNERITVMWNRTLQEDTLMLPAVGDVAQLISMSGSNTVAPLDGVYRLELPPAASDVDISMGPYGGAAVGGEPFVLIETITRPEVVPGIDWEDMPTLEPRPTITPPLNVPTLPPPYPTMDPALDITPPIAYILPLPETSEANFTVMWEGTDNSGIDNYLIWVRVDDEDWQPWLNTLETAAMYSGESGHTYYFCAWAVDLADNWSENINLEVQASTRVE